MKGATIFVFVVLQVWFVSAQSGDPGIIVFKHANVIDGVSNKPLLDVMVLTANGKIAGIGSDMKPRVSSLPRQAYQR